MYIVCTCTSRIVIVFTVKRLNSKSYYYCYSLYGISSNRYGIPRLIYYNIIRREHYFRVETDEKTNYRSLFFFPRAYICTVAPNTLDE